MDIEKQAHDLVAAIDDAVNRLKISDLETDLLALQLQTSNPDLWADQTRAQSLMKQQSDLDARISAWRKLQRSASDIQELLAINDTSLEADLRQQLKETQAIYDKQKAELLFSGPHDSYSAIISIHAGAGGTDAQDWTEMLLRMYVRYAEQAGFSIVPIDQSDGEEAGIKSVTMEINGPFAYGKLKSEHGVHRLVRLSPFNSDNLRQTSFAKVEIMPKVDHPEDIVIDEKELKIDVYRSGGKGGQSVNTTDSAVRITHIPTGIVVAIQNERSQLQNKETAMTILRSKLAQLQIEQHAESLRELKGPNQSAEWGNQIRSYVLHPYKQVKDLRTRMETSDTESILDGNLDSFINAYLEDSIN